MNNLLEIKKVLGTPYYERGNFLLYNRDCLENLRLIEESIIDLTITSPPYNIGKEYEEVKPLDDYIYWCKEWIKEIYKITKKNGAFLLNIGYLKVPNKGQNVPISYLLWDKTDFYLKQEII